MEVRATAKYIRVQPRKVRIIADEIRGKNAGHAAALLHHHTSKGAKSLRKVLINAVANAVENHGLAPENLKVSVIMVDQGPVLKRMTAKAMGRGARILKKTSHITVVVEEAEPEVAVRPHGAKAKPRPTFATKTGGPRNPKPPTPGNTDDGTVPPPVEHPSDPNPHTDPTEEPSTTTPEALATEPEATSGVVAEGDGASSEPVEATPVTASESPEEGSTESPTATTEAPKAEGADEENNA